MNKHKAEWTAEKRAAQSKRMKRIWAARRQAVSIEPPIEKLPRHKTDWWLKTIKNFFKGAH